MGLIAFLKKKYKDFTHVHIWTYHTYLYRECDICPVIEKRAKDYYFKGTDMVKFDRSWEKYIGSKEEFKNEWKKFKENLMKCKTHQSEIEKARFGMWAVYNETMIRQNRAFPHYGIGVLMPEEMMTRK